MAGECELSPGEEEQTGISASVLIGIVMAVLASTASNLGVNVQKYSFIRESEEVRVTGAAALWFLGPLQHATPCRASCVQGAGRVWVAH